MKTVKKDTGVDRRVSYSDVINRALNKYRAQFQHEENLLRRQLKEKLKWNC